MNTGESTSGPFRLNGLVLEIRLTPTARLDRLAETGGELVTTLTLTVKASEGLQPWHVVRLPRAG